MQVARPIGKFLMGFAAVAGVLLVATIVVTLRRPVPPPPTLPKPNGYDDFVRAGLMLEGDASDWPKLTQQQLRGLVATNAEALKVVRIGLSRQCQVPLGDSPNSTNHVPLAAIKCLAQNLAAEGRLAELEGRTNDAVTSYVDTIRFGCESPRGGGIDHSLVGIAMESIGMSCLENVTASLDAKRCRELASMIERAEANAESSETIRQHDLSWCRHEFGRQWDLARLVYFKSENQRIQRWSGKATSAQLRRRRLMLELAARAYKLEKGEPPKSVSDLVPGYIKTIPQDPVTGTNMVLGPVFR